MQKHLRFLVLCSFLLYVCSLSYADDKTTSTIGLESTTTTLTEDNKTKEPTPTTLEELPSTTVKITTTTTATTTSTTTTLKEASKDDFTIKKLTEKDGYAQTLTLSAKEALRINESDFDVSEAFILSFPEKENLSGNENLTINITYAPYSLGEKNETLTIKIKDETLLDTAYHYQGFLNKERTEQENEAIEHLNLTDAPDGLTQDYKIYSDQAYYFNQNEFYFLINSSEKRNITVSYTLQEPDKIFFDNLEFLDYDGNWSKTNTSTQINRSTIFRQNFHNKEATNTEFNISVVGEDGFTAFIDPIIYSWYYQEDANASSGPIELFNGDWSDYAYGFGNAYANYTPPVFGENVTVGLSWKIKYLGHPWIWGTITKLINISNIHPCWNDTQFRTKIYSTTDPMAYTSIWYCWNYATSDWLALESYSGSDSVEGKACYEEGVYWDVMNKASILNVTVDNQIFYPENMSFRVKANTTNSETISSCNLTLFYVVNDTAMVDNVNMTLEDTPLWWNYSYSHRAGGLWNWSITCTDTVGTTDSKNSSYTMVNTKPTLSSCMITPSPAQVTDNLTGDANATDYENGTLTYSWRWFKNGERTDNISLVFGAGNYSLGDNITLQCNASDGFNETLLNSSTLTIGDTTVPTLTCWLSASSGYTDTAYTIYCDCSDANALYLNYPKVDFLDPNAVRQGNFTLSLDAAPTYLKTYTFAIVGTYTDFNFYCMDGSGNLQNLTNSTATFLASTRPSSTPGGGGGGGVPGGEEEPGTDFTLEPMAPCSLYYGVSCTYRVINNLKGPLNLTITGFGSTQYLLSSHIGGQVVERGGELGLVIQENLPLGIDKSMSYSAYLTLESANQKETLNIKIRWQPENQAQEVGWWDTPVQRLVFGDQIITATNLHVTTVLAGVGLILVYALTKPRPRRGRHKHPYY